MFNSLIIIYLDRNEVGVINHSYKTLLELQEYLNKFGKSENSILSFCVAHKDAFLTNKNENPFVADFIFYQDDHNTRIFSFLNYSDSEDYKNLKD